MQNKETMERLNNPPEFGDIKKVSLVDMIESALDTFKEADMNSKSMRHNIANVVYNMIINDMTEITTADEFNNTYLKELDRNTLILKRIKERLDLGQLRYGGDVPKEDGRNWIRETLEEVLDSLVYATNKLLILEEMEVKDDVS